jgi:hypothetical protein
MIRIKHLALILTALIATAASVPVRASDDADKIAEKMAQWQEEAKDQFNIKYDKFTTQSTITTKRLKVAKRGLVSLKHDPNISMVVSYSYKGVEMTRKPTTLELILICEVRDKHWPIHQPAEAGSTPNENNSLDFIVDDKPLQMGSAPSYSYDPGVEYLSYKITTAQFSKLARGSIIQARLGKQEFLVKDFPLVVLKEVLKRLNAVK